MLISKVNAIITSWLGELWDLVRARHEATRVTAVFFRCTPIHKGAHTSGLLAAVAATAAAAAMLAIAEAGMFGGHCCCVAEKAASCWGFIMENIMGLGAMPPAAAAAAAMGLLLTAVGVPGSPMGGPPFMCAIMPRCA